jgi:hypothetical protein
VNVGERNGAFVHRKNETCFLEIDSEIKAYLLGLIAGDGSIDNKRIALHANKNDVESLNLLRSFVAPTLNIVPDENCLSVKINSTRIVEDICGHLRIVPGKKCYSLSLPNLPDELMWHFIRGLSDSDGSITNPWFGCTSPRCKITSYSDAMRFDIEKFCDKYDINSCVGKTDVYFVGRHALSFLNHIYENSNFSLSRKFELYKIWKTWRPYKGTCVRPGRQSKT